MANLSILSATREPWVLQSSDSFDELVAQIESRLPDDTHIVVLEGNAMRCTDGFYNELVEKLKLPDYFGRNLNALDECVTDLEWLGLAGQPVVVIVRDAEVILQSDRDGFEGFIDVMRNACEEWSNAVAEGSEWDRPAVPFHVVLNCRELEAFKAQAFPYLEIP